MRRIIIIDHQQLPAGASKLTAAFWIPLPSGSRYWGSRTTTSRVPDATPAELQALASGQFVERIQDTVTYPSGTTLAIVRADVLAMYSLAVSDAATSEASGGLEGMSWDGSGWSPGTPFTQPEATATAASSASTDAPAAAVVRAARANDDPGARVVLANIDEKLGQIVDLIREFISS